MALDRLLGWLWKSRWATALFLLLYGAWVVHGTRVALQNLENPDATVPVEATVLHTADHRVVVRGEMIMHRRSAQVVEQEFVGRLALRIQAPPGPATLRVWLQPVDCLSTDHLTLRSGSAETHRVRGLHHPVVRLNLPVKGGSSWELELSRADARLRFQSFDLQPATTATTFSSSLADRVIKRGDANSFELGLGSGWRIPEGGNDPTVTELRMLRRASLLLTVAAPGPYRVTLPLRLTHADQPPPRVFLGSDPVDVKWECDGDVGHIILECDCESSNVIGLESPEPPALRFDVDGRNEFSRVSYVLVVERIEVVPRR